MKRKSAKVKNRFILVFLAITFVLAMVRIVFPGVAKGQYAQGQVKHAMTMDSALDDGKAYRGKVSKEKIKTVKHTIKRQTLADAGIESVAASKAVSRFFYADGTLVKNKIVGVPDYDESFPDMQDVQLSSAKKYGVPPVLNRADAEKRKNQLVFVGFNPYFEVKKLYSSIPYLVPRASLLLQDIGRNFMDSLQTKGLPVNKLLVTSVLRTKEDVAKLRRFNHNATENSCHLYGTTFDIAYNKYVPVGREVRNDTLKWVLSEVLNDLRNQGRCYIKHERHQGCFHITVR